MQSQDSLIPILSATDPLSRAAFAVSLALALVATSAVSSAQAPSPGGGDAGGISSVVLASARDGETEPAAKPASPRAEELRQRIREMRMNLLTGGPHVHAAEAEAAEFFRGKGTLIEDRLDTVLVELSEKRATYDASLESALENPNPTSRAGAMKKALAQRSAIAALEAEAQELERKRGDVGRLTSSIEARSRERGSLRTRLETNGELDTMLDVPTGMIGLAPAVSEAAAVASPFDDETLIQDLMQRDARGARQLLFDSDPDRYWERFPLRPPVDALQGALKFPLADLPGRR